jgi:hypothetical protein
VYSGSVGTGAWGAFMVSDLDDTGQSGRVHQMTAQVTDTAGNVGTSGILNVTIDTTPPTPNISPTATPTSTCPVPYTITFNETVAYFDATKYTVTNGTKYDFDDSANPVFDIEVIPNQGGADQTTTVDVAAGQCEDLAGNSSLAATGTKDCVYRTIVIDGSPVKRVVTPAANTWTSVNFTINDNSNRILLVGLAIREAIAGTPTINYVRWNIGPQNLAVVNPGIAADTGWINNRRVIWYYLVNPTAGTSNVSANFSGNVSGEMVIFPLNNVLQAGTFGTPVVNTAGSGTYVTNNATTGAAYGSWLFSGVAGNSTELVSITQDSPAALGGSDITVIALPSGFSYSIVPNVSTSYGMGWTYATNQGAIIHVVFEVKTSY